jgi:ankyrin repeat protein
LPESCLSLASNITFAAQHGKTAALDFLHLHGADIHLLDSQRRNPLHWSAYKDSIITTNWLIRRGVDQFREVNAMLLALLTHLIALSCPHFSLLFALSPLSTL